MDVNFNYVGNGNLIVIHSIDSDMYRGLDLKTLSTFDDESVELLGILSHKINCILLDKYYIAAANELKSGKKIGKIKDIHILTNGDFLSLSMTTANCFFVGDGKILGSGLFNFVDEKLYEGCTVHAYVNGEKNKPEVLQERFPDIKVHNIDHVLIMGDEVARTYKFDDRSNIESIMTQKITKLGG